MTLLQLTEKVNINTDMKLLQNIIDKYSENIINDFLNLLDDYMNFSDKSAISKLYNLCQKNKLLLAFKIDKVYRVMLMNNNKIDLGNREFISTSIEKLKGSVLKNVINDMEIDINIIKR